jgi:hypothetical protein
LDYHHRFANDIRYPHKYEVTEPVPKPQANHRTTTFAANLQENLTAKAPNAAPETLRALYNYATRCGANKGLAFLFKHQRRSTEAQKVFTDNFALCCQSLCFVSLL